MFYGGLAYETLARPRLLGVRRSVLLERERSRKNSDRGEIKEAPLDSNTPCLARECLPNEVRGREAEKDRDGSIEKYPHCFYLLKVQFSVALLP